MGEICLKEERRERLKGRGKIDRKFESVLEEEIHETLKMSKNMRRRDTMITNNQNSGFRMMWRMIWVFIRVQVK